MYLQYLCKVVSCELPPVCVCHLDLLLGDFICHGRCPYTTTPQGEIRHAAWLSLPLPIYHCFSALFICPALLPLSLSTFSPFSCHQCLCPPSHSLHLPSPPSISPSALHWAMAVNRLQESRQSRGSTRISYAGRRWASASIQQDCWQVIAWKSVAEFNLFLPLKLTGQTVKYCQIMMLCKDENTWLLPFRSQSCRSDTLIVLAADVCQV